VRRAAWILAAAALVAVLVVGIVQGRTETERTPKFDLAEARRSLAGAPGPLAALHARSNVIQPGADVATYEATLRQLKGHPVVVNLWATWCAPCKLEFPIFQQVSTKLGRRVAFLGVNVEDNRERAEAFLRKRPVPYPSLEDGGARIWQSLGVGQRLPVTVFYDPDGRRFIRQGGYTTQADLIRDVERYAGA
jgi:cytochrome c biogenesis protein CcmG, thiol:disulfide interchange protein DsbE